MAAWLLRLQTEAWDTLPPNRPEVSPAGRLGSGFRVRLLKRFFAGSARTLSSDPPGRNFSNSRPRSWAGTHPIDCAIQHSAQSARHLSAPARSFAGVATFYENGFFPRRLGFFP